MSSLPTGTITFLLSDIEASTRLIQRLGDALSEQVFADHRRLLTQTVESVGGYVHQDQGESFLFVFSRAKDAVLGAVAAQRALAKHVWPDQSVVRVRMGLHTGQPTVTTAGYVGLDLHRTARICSAGHGGQILLSQTTRDLAEDGLPEGISLRDLGEHRLKDLSRPQRLFQVVIPDLPDDFPPLRSLDVLPNNLPIQLTSFIGREREKAEARRLLSTTRLLTFTGSGGAGKTRLALQVAAELLEEFRDGVWVVELASLSDPTLVPKAVTSALGLPEQPGRPLTDTLVDYLRPRSLLLVLDNCEHLLVACAELADSLLRACPTVRILATSREALNIEGETAYRVLSLSSPDVASAPFERLVEFEAVRLFVDRATTALPSFVVTASAARQVATICQRLDGIPLALELAAARVKALSVEHIAERLHDRFRLLTSGRRTALPRHQTLRATMDWSYELLSEPERVLLQRLAVFAGGFTLDAAEAICLGDRVGAEDVVDLLTHLVEKSLVVLQEWQGRHQLLETVRQYAWEKLLKAGEEIEIRGRHLDWYLALAEQADPELRGPRQRLWLNRLEAEHDNLRAALEWSQTQGARAEVGLRLAMALHLFWYTRGYFSEGRRRLENALARRSEAPDSVVAAPLSWAALFAWRQGDYERSKVLCETGLNIGRKAGDKSATAFCLMLLGVLAAQQQDYGQGTGRMQDALTLAREARDKWLTAMTLTQLGNMSQFQGDYKQAVTYHEESLVLVREMGDEGGIAFTLRLLGRTALYDRDYGRARALFAESLVLSRDLGALWIIQECLEGLAGVAIGSGRAKAAARLFGAAEDLRDHLGLHRPGFYQTMYERHLANVRAELGVAAYSAASAEGRAMTLKQAIEYALSDDAWKD